MLELIKMHPAARNVSIIAAVLVAYVLACALQVHIISEGVGLSIPFTNVVFSTMKLILNGPWIPFVMTPTIRD